MRGRLAHNLAGQVFGRWTVIERVGNSRTGKVRWRCRCECGKEREVSTGHLIRGKTKSCGCLRRDMGRHRAHDLTGRVFMGWTVMGRVENATWRGARWLCLCRCGNERVVLASSLTQGKTKSCGSCWSHLIAQYPKEHCAWSRARSRCHNPDDLNYRNYAGRGLTMAPEWRAPGIGFKAFLDHIKPRKGPGLSLDRIDNNRGYWPGNVRWATPKEQNNNRRPPIRHQRIALESRSLWPNGTSSLPITSGMYLISKIPAQTPHNVGAGIEK